MSDFAIDANQLVKKFPARPGTGNKTETPSPPQRRSAVWQARTKSHVHRCQWVDLQIQRGEIFGLLGPNGAGKSTTIRMLCTLLEPTSGTARINGFDLVAQANDVRRSLGTLLAGERSIYWKLTGRENLEYFAALYHIPATVARQRVRRIDRTHGAQGARQRTRRKIFNRDAPASRHCESFACSSTHPPFG